jgi:hypothetical protein
MSYVTEELSFVPYNKQHCYWHWLLGFMFEKPNILLVDTEFLPLDYTILNFHQNQPTTARIFVITADNDTDDEHFGHLQL